MPPDEVSDVKSEKPKKKKKENLDSGVVKGEGKKKKKSKNAKEKLKSNIEETKAKKTKDQDRTKGPRISVKEKKEKGANNETTVTKKRSKKSFKEPKQGSKIESVIEAPDIPTQDSVTNVEDINEGASETSEDRRMKDVLTRWNQDDDSSDSSDVSSDFSDEDQYCVDGHNSVHMTKEELGLEDNALDHILLAAPDFDEAMKDFETLTAIRPSIAGSLKGLGCLTARIGLDKQAYIDIIAPDPDKPGPIGEHLKQMEHGSFTPIHYAVRRGDLSDLAEDYVPNELGYTPDRIKMFMAGTDGTPKKWEMLFMHGHFHGGVVPYFVDWGECEHPIGSIAQAGSLKSFEVSCLPGSKVHTLLKGMKDVTVVDSDVVGLKFSFLSPEGTVTFSAQNPQGLKFPGLEESNEPAVGSENESSSGSLIGNSVQEENNKSGDVVDVDPGASSDRSEVESSDSEAEEGDDLSQGDDDDD
jgi:Glyoxalase-like domain